MKIVLFAPGYMEDINSRDYKATLQAIRSKGYKVKFVPITWRRTTIDSWANELEAEYKKHDPRQTILAGFSYGAMTAFLVASQRLPSELWLFSLSPYFSEDVPNLEPQWLRRIGAQRTERFSQLSFDKLAPKVSCKSLLFIGEKEAKKYPDLAHRCQQAVTKLPHAQLIKIEGAGHDVTNSKYINAIKEAI